MLLNAYNSFPFYVHFHLDTESVSDFLSVRKTVRSCVRKTSDYVSCTWHDRLEGIHPHHAIHPQPKSTTAMLGVTRAHRRRPMCCTLPIHWQHHLAKHGQKNIWRPIHIHQQHILCDQSIVLSRRGHTLSLSLESQGTECTSYIRVMKNTSFHLTVIGCCSSINRWSPLRFGSFW